MLVYQRVVEGKISGHEVDLVYGYNQFETANAKT